MRILNYVAVNRQRDQRIRVSKLLLGNTHGDALFYKQRGASVSEACKPARPIPSLFSSGWSFLWVNLQGRVFIALPPEFRVVGAQIYFCKGCGLRTCDKYCDGRNSMVTTCLTWTGLLSKRVGL